MAISMLRGQPVPVPMATRRCHPYQLPAASLAASLLIKCHLGLALLLLLPVTHTSLSWGWGKRVGRTRLLKKVQGETHHSWARSAGKGLAQVPVLDATDSARERAQLQDWKRSVVSDL